MKFGKFLTAALWLGLASAAVAGPRSEVAIRDVVMSSGAHRYLIPVTIGGTTLDAGLDTGSTGLRVLSSALAPGDAKPTSEASDYNYGVGVRYRGVIAKGLITLAGATGEVPLALIRQVGCTDKIPDCPASKVNPAHYRIMGDGRPDEGVFAIIGLNMAGNAAPNPLQALGVSRWIVDLPRPGDTAAGRLVLDPADAELDGYSWFNLTPQNLNMVTGFHDAIPACVSALSEKICGLALLDSGAPGIRIALRKPHDAWSNSTAAQVTFGSLTSNFIVGSKAQTARLVFTQMPVSAPQLYLGTLPFFAFSVAYDPGHNRIGLKPR